MSSTSSSSSSKARLKTIAVTPKHLRDKSICSTLTDDLREQHRRRSIRVIKGDTVKVMRGEYTGIEGKVEKVNTIRGTLSIEGVQREKVKGGNVKVQIHSSNVRVSGLNLDDKYRQDRVRGQEQGQSAEKDTSMTMDNNGKNSDKKKRDLNIGNKKKASLVKKGSSKKNNINKTKKNRIKDHNEAKNKTTKNNDDNNNENKSQLKNQSNEEKGG
jgi:large subunit ribosomal protein L24